MESFVKGIALGAALTLVIALIDGTYGVDYLSGDYSLVGLFRSKNQIGFVAEIGILAAFIIFFLNVFSVLDKLFFSLMFGAICVVSLLLSKSAAALLSLLAVMGSIIVIYVITWLPRRIRLPFFCLSAAAIACMAVMAVNAGLTENVLAILGKSDSLTGRTYLWQEGYKIGQERPWLGHGYSAFWVAGQPQAERYWNEFRITEKTGFHFHNMFIQTFVELGYVGTALLSLLMLMGVLKSFLRVMYGGPELENIFLLALSVMFVIRAFVEADSLGPFGIGTLLFFFVIIRIFQPLRTANPPTYTTLINSRG
jgi:exopolysaccharide production protein ExoQ